MELRRSNGFVVFVYNKKKMEAIQMFNTRRVLK